MFGMAPNLTSRLAASTLVKAGILAKYPRLCIETVAPHTRHREYETLPNVEYAVTAALKPMEE